MRTENAIAAMLEDMLWLEQVIDYAIKSYLQHEGYTDTWLNIPVPSHSGNNSPYAEFIEEWQLNVFERLALALALAPHIRPQVLDTFLAKNQVIDRGFTEFGGLTDRSHTGFLPTGQTFSFIVTSAGRELYPVVIDTLGRNSRLVQELVIVLGSTDQFIPFLNGMLCLGDSWFLKLLTDENTDVMSASFPAKKIATQLTWPDVVLDMKVVEQIGEIRNWLKHGNTLMHEWGLAKKIKPGYKCLFYGPPGTGKTLTATLLGAENGLDVYRVDLSMVVSKYIGETEKNIAAIFDIAERKNWILLFDEADSLFGKRTEMNSSNDRYANQQTGYLLQRVEDYPGTVVLATNLKANVDEAFTRRFQSVIHFNMPAVNERHLLWQKAFSGTCTLHPDIDVYKVAQDYELAGGSIINILRTCAISAISRQDTVVTRPELLAAIKKEFKKANRNLVIT